MRRNKIYLAIGILVGILLISVISGYIISQSKPQNIVNAVEKGETKVLENYVNENVEVEGVIKETIHEKLGEKVYVLCDLKNFSTYHYVYNSNTKRFERAFEKDCVYLVKPCLSSEDAAEIRKYVESLAPDAVNKTVRVTGKVFVYDTPCDEPTQVPCMRFVGIDPEDSYENAHKQPGAILTSPPNNVTTTNSTIPFAWYIVEGAKEYLIQVDNDSNLSSPEIESYVINAEFFPKDPLPDDTYYWRVKVVYVDGTESTWSNTWEITILTNLRGGDYK